MKRWLSIGLLGILGGLVAVGALYQLSVPGGLLRFYHTIRAPRPFDASQYMAFKVGEKFPDLQLKTVEGSTSRISNLPPHKVLLVNFFASW